VGLAFLRASAAGEEQQVLAARFLGEGGARRGVKVRPRLRRLRGEL
jgi:hypothetical protein